MPVRPGGATDPASRIERVLRGQEARMRRAFDTAVNIIRDETTLERLADLLERGLFEEALAGLELAAQALAAQQAESLIAAARDTAQFLSTAALTVTVSFDVSNTRAVRIMQENRLALVREFSDAQRAATREALTQGILDGANPREQARRFRESIGLTQRQTQSVNNFRRLLTAARQDGLPSREALDRALRDRRFDRSILRAIRDNEPLTGGQVDTMVGRYEARLRRHRSEVIARTEALRAVHQGTEEMYRQAIDAGQIRPEQLSRTWVTAQDERVRDSHQRLNGEVRAFGEVWEAEGGVLRFPGDPAAPASETIQCRCVLSTRMEP